MGIRKRRRKNTRERASVWKGREKKNIQTHTKHLPSNRLRKRRVSLLRFSSSVPRFPPLLVSVSRRRRPSLSPRPWRDGPRPSSCLDVGVGIGSPSASSLRKARTSSSNAATSEPASSWDQASFLFLLLPPLSSICSLCFFFSLFSFFSAQWRLFLSFFLSSSSLFPFSLFLFFSFSFNLEPQVLVGFEMFPSREGGSVEIAILKCESGKW